jgi:hypothetical protein
MRSSIGLIWRVMGPMIGRAYLEYIVVSLIVAFAKYQPSIITSPVLITTDSLSWQIAHRGWSTWIQLHKTD